MTNWPEIVSTYGPLVWKTASRLLSNDADVSDCFQRTFVSALEFVGKKPVLKWPALLKRMATARAMEQLRDRYRRSARQADWPGPIADESALDPCASLEAAELADQMRQALAKIDHRQADVFCLASLENLSYREIADQMGVSVNHVGVLLNRARANLRLHLEAHAPLNDEHGVP